MNALTIRKYFDVIVSWLFKRQRVKSKHRVVLSRSATDAKWVFVNPSETVTTGGGDLSGETHQTILWIDGNVYRYE